MRPSLDSEDALATASLLSPLRERPLAVEPVETAEARLRRIVPQLEALTSELVAKRGRRKGWSRAGWLLAALATGLGAGVLYARSSAPEEADGLIVSGELVEIDAADERTKLSGSLEVSPLGRVETGEAGARISTREGLDVELGPLTSARIGQLGGGRLAQRVRLDSGSIRCSVPKLAAGREFSVATPNALVVVHGTRFSVEVEPTEDGIKETCVRVTEGRVAVHVTGAPVVFLGPGEQHGCAPQVSAQSQATLPAPAPQPELAKGESATPSAPKANPAKAEGTLEREVELLQAALRAEQNGDLEGARQKLRRLLQRYPSSPLREDATSMLRRLSSSRTAPSNGTLPE